LPHNRFALVVGTFDISSRVELAEALQAEIDRSFAGNRSKAAAFAKVSLSTLNRYTHGGSLPNGSKTGSRRVTRISPAIARKLSTLLPCEQWSKLYTSREKAYGLFLYTRWLGEMLDQAGARRRPHEKRAGRPSPYGPWIGRCAELKTLLRRVRDEVPGVTTRIATMALRLTRIDRETRNLLDTLGVSQKQAPAKVFKAGQKRGVPAKNAITPARFSLALYRVFEPLLDSAASGWIERRGNELSRREFGQFVNAGWRREAILLDRVSDVRRVDRLQLGLHEDDPRLLPLRTRH
jgi:hypothetical protein